mmetsp:Transcript_1451/g.3662  ORF Transcript_1451/g.3662 Transcript_1451/m.3662 type:complete len:170 (+) Transcript_1451:316-825(+)
MPIHHHNNPYDEHTYIHSTDIVFAYVQVAYVHHEDDDDHDSRVDGVSATCATRLLWAAQHETAEQERPCEATHALVQGQCSKCGACSAEAAMCMNDVAADEVIFKRLLQKFGVESIHLGTQAETKVAHALFATMSMVGVGASLVVLVALRGRMSRDECEAYVQASTIEA